VKFGWSFLKRIRPLLVIAGLVALVSRSVVVAQETLATPARGVNPVLQAGDVVRLKIWREPDLSGDYRVDERGVATFPRIGPLRLSQLPTDSLKFLLVSTYARYLQNPSIEVIFLRRINVLGEVKTPGLYDVDPTMSVADVLAMAGGVTPDGNPKKIELFRRGERRSRLLSPQSRMTNSPLQSGDQLVVPERSWISRNPGIVGAAITAAAVVVATLLR
jgi:protein involved in polysaccharide export with SLBB domain